MNNEYFDPPPVPLAWPPVTPRLFKARSRERGIKRYKEVFQKGERGIKRYGGIKRYTGGICKEVFPFRYRYTGGMADSAVNYVVVTLPGAGTPNFD